MNIFEAIVLGLIQGLTEFLPVSSSGHLELGKYLFGIDHEANFYFSIAVHGATVLSTLFVLWKEIAGLFKGIFAFKMNDETRYVIKLFISMIPVGISGLFMSQIATKFFAGNMISLGIEFLISALFLGLTLIIRPREREMTYLDSFIIGLAQALAVLPGVSRSGATIATGMMLGNKKADIAKFFHRYFLRHAGSIPVVRPTLRRQFKNSASCAALSMVSAALAAAILGIAADTTRSGNLHKWISARSSV